MMLASFSAPTVPKESRRRKSKTYLILGLILTAVVTLACIIIFAYACRQRIARMIKQGGNFLFFLLNYWCEI